MRMGWGRLSLWLKFCHRSQGKHFNSQKTTIAHSSQTSMWCGRKPGGGDVVRAVLCTCTRNTHGWVSVWCECDWATQSRACKEQYRYELLWVSWYGKPRLIRSVSDSQYAYTCHLKNLWRLLLMSVFLQHQTKCHRNLMFLPMAFP